MDCEIRRRGKLCGRGECKHCFDRSFASVEKSKYMAEGQGNSLLMAKSSAKKYSFVCPTCEHSFETSPNNISNGRFCAFCSNRKLCLSDKCEACFGKSFASHEKAQFWSFEKNGQTPREVFRNTHKKFWFKCESCAHLFDANLNNVFNGNFCPFCGNIKLCPSSVCKTCFEKSFASHEKAQFWSFEKNKRIPREVFSRSEQKYWFDCRKCEHSFETAVSSIFAGHFCPFCSSKNLCSSGDCKTCFEKSFASHKRAKFWDFEKNKQMPRETFTGSEKKFWFKCEKNHKFSNSLYCISKGCWCPKCKNKTEAKLLKFLEEHFGGAIYQFKISWCKNPETNRLLPFDFCISKTIIELDGAQHYAQVSNWKSPEETQKSDRFKEQCATNNGYSVLRILQEDVWNDKIDWKTLLLEHIKDYETPTIKRLW
ncbi:conserved putative restriction endonuclease [Melbournevirus]|uniref:conserved putative restriction endonuclease n=1 Tax=Melbournevirus TaxID=1560514 RepID=UPI00051F52AD|nr:conserved putative restriction endonuclease [Melbournevirus]AIT54978.1 restriction endonuclease [Melbournevirus]